MSVFSEEQVTPATQSEQETSFEGVTTPSIVGDLVGDCLLYTSDAADE